MNSISIFIPTLTIYIYNSIPIIIYTYSIIPIILPIIQVEEGEEEEAQGEEEKAIREEERAKEDLNSLSDLDELLFCRSVNQVKVRTAINIPP